MDLLIKVIFTLIVVGLFSCSSEKVIDNPKEFYQWMNNPENGLVQSKSINNVKISVKYLPPSFLAYRQFKEMKNKNEKVRDSLVKAYSHSKTFLLSIAADEKAKGNTGDIMFSNISGYEEYSERSFQMNFELANYIHLDAGSQEYFPVISTMENSYGVSSGRNMLLVFQDKKSKGELNTVPQLDFVFNDEIFNTGINHFVFDSEKLSKIPHFIF